MHGNNINNTTTTGTTGSSIMAKAAAVDGAIVRELRPRIGSTTFGSAVQTADRHNAGVRVVAARYDNFEDALLPMVLASGVTGDAAIAVADAIKSNPALRAQAERAFQRSQLSAV